MKTTIKIKDVKIDLEYSIQPADREVGIDNPYVDEFKVLSVSGFKDEKLCAFFDDYLSDNCEMTEEAIMNNHNKEMEESRYNISAEDYELTIYR